MTDEDKKKALLDLMHQHMTSICHIKNTVNKHTLYSNETTRYHIERLCDCLEDGLCFIIGDIVDAVYHDEDEK